MRHALLLTLMLVLLAGCGRISTLTPVSLFNERDYQWHKQTHRIKVHWNYVRPGDGTIIADGYVEPFSPGYGLNGVKLELVGLDAKGNVVSSAKGRPADEIIMPPSYESYFRITMQLTGAERKFTIRGGYHWFQQGVTPNASRDTYQDIPLVADEPY